MIWLDMNIHGKSSHLYFACTSFRSRLGCQVCLRKDLDGMILRVPDVISDARVDSEKESSTAPPKA